MSCVARSTSSAARARSATTQENHAVSTSEEPSGTSTSPAPDAASTPRPTDACRVEVEIRKGHKAIPKRLWINGVEIPNVVSVIASYKALDMRRVTIELAPTDFIEIDPESEQSSADGDTVQGP